MDQIIFKTAAAISILLLTLATGLIPLKIAETKKHLLCLGDAFASGVFLSAALLHLLPDASNGFQNILGTDCYPWASLICLAAFVLLLIMERSVIAYSQHRFYDIKNTMPLLLVLLLTIHALVEGAAIGAGINLAETSMIFLAVVAHKSSESFSLAINLYHYNLSAKNIRRIMAIFACVTPLGIFIASFITYVLQSGSGSILSAILSAVTAGTFLYLGTEHMIEDTKSMSSIAEILSLMAGITLMALIAIWA